MSCYVGGCFINMKWTTDKPKYAEYYWAIYKDSEDLLDCSPEIVKVYFDGRLKVYRPGLQERFEIEDFYLWSNDYIKIPE